MSELKHGDIDPATGESVVITPIGVRMSWPTEARFFSFDDDGCGYFTKNMPRTCAGEWVIENKDMSVWCAAYNWHGDWRQSLLKRYPNKEQDNG